MTDYNPLEMLTVVQVGKLLNVSRPTVEKFIRLGELASMTIGRCRRVRRIDLEDFIERHRQYGWHTYQPVAPLSDYTDDGEIAF